MSGRQLNSVKYRCAECGAPKRYRDDFVEGEGTRVLRCARHPDAKILAWSFPYEAALFAIDREMKQSRLTSIDELREIVMNEPEPMFKGFGLEEFAVCAALWEKWGGMPERRLPANLPHRHSPVGLYS